MINRLTEFGNRDYGVHTSNRSAQCYSYMAGPANWELDAPNPESPRLSPGLGDRKLAKTKNNITSGAWFMAVKLPSVLAME